MSVRFDAAARQSIIAATIAAEKQGRARPAPVDLLLGLMSLPESPVSSGAPGLGAEARALIAAATATIDPAARARNHSPEDAERILRRAGELASARSSDAEVGIFDILAAALAGIAGPDAAVASDGRELVADVAPAPLTRPVSPLPGPSPTATARSGIGYDSHRFGDTGPLILGGVTIEDSMRLVGHSDGDAIAHAITDAILGAAGAGDIGEMFPDTDPVNRGRDSLEMLRAAVRRVAALGFTVHHVDATVVAERPKIARHREAMKAALAGALGIDTGRVSVKGKTNEGMGWVGRGEGIACIAVATLAPSSNP